MPEALLIGSHLDLRRRLAHNGGDFAQTVEFSSEWGFLPIINIAMHLSLDRPMPPPHQLFPMASEEAERFIDEMPDADYSDLLDERGSAKFEAIVRGSVYVTATDHDDDSYSCRELMEEVETIRLLIEREIETIDAPCYAYELETLLATRQACQAALSAGESLVRHRYYRTIPYLRPVFPSARRYEGFDTFMTVSIEAHRTVLSVSLATGWTYHLPARFLWELLRDSVVDSPEPTTLVEWSREAENAIEVVIRHGEVTETQYFWTNDIHYLCEPCSTEFGDVRPSLRSIIEKWMGLGGFRVWPLDEPIMVSR